MSELSREAKAFLEAHRADGEPSAADAERVAAALQQVLSPAVAAAPWYTSVRFAKAMVTAGLLGLGLFLATRTETPVRVEETRREVETPVRPAPAVPPVVIAPPAPAVEVQRPRHVMPRPVPAAIGLPPEAPLPEKTQLDVPPPSAEPPSPPPERAAPELPDEVVLVSEAQDQLRQGHAREALNVLAQWESRFGKSGQFGQEARATRIVALCVSGQLLSGREEARRYFSEFPGSPHRNRIERGCGSP